MNGSDIVFLVLVIFRIRNDSEFALHIADLFTQNIEESGLIEKKLIGSKLDCGKIRIKVKSPHEITGIFGEEIVDFRNNIVVSFGICHKVIITVFVSACQLHSHGKRQMVGTVNRIAGSDAISGGHHMIGIKIGIDHRAHFLHLVEGPASVFNQFIQGCHIS